ncbi:hypothetical protein P0W64_08240 [Tsukamurella sp. 8F]|uniref:hypothetical protein n=1 Tax=unclassified Tsukamurella TaxID=2633480 RepID=UPI0023B92DA6|nr:MULTISPECIES: hypothetical protein [unclassified Tsukamurella]MDF0528922.1 hypothetical protein [Tsukamurella sp. 8J]MDF0586757.1 hypothetical protein [Tsukamurella sp. 8F]
MNAPRNAPASPRTARIAGGLIAVEGAAGLVVGVVELIRGLTAGAESPRGAYGLAFWLIPMGAAVLAGGWALWTGRRWGRTLGVLANLLLLPVGYSMAFPSGRPLLGLPVLVLAVAVLVLLFSPGTVGWLDRGYGRRGADADEPGEATGEGSDGR